MQQAICIRCARGAQVLAVVQIAQRGGPEMATRQEEITAYIGRIVDQTGLTVTEIARRAGLSPSTLTRAYPTPQVSHVLSSRTVAKITNAFPDIDAAVVSRRTYPTNRTWADGKSSRASALVSDAATPFAGPVMATVPLYATTLLRWTRPAAIPSGAEIEQLALKMERPIRDVAKPINLVESDVFALYVSGSAMEPRMRSGDMIFVQQDRPPRTGGDVLVTLSDPTEPDTVFAIVRTLVRQTPDMLYLEQYAPALQFALSMDQVTSVNPVLTLSDLYV